MQAAAASRSLEVVQQVLGALGSSRAAEQLGGATSALHGAARLGYLVVTQALVAAGADREQQDSDNCVPLHVALALGHCHLVPLLVTPGNVNQQYFSSSTHASEKQLDGSNPLHLAVRHGGGVA
jgi:ankyrin repeat protein